MRCSSGISATCSGPVVTALPRLATISPSCDGRPDANGASTPATGEAGDGAAEATGFEIVLDGVVSTGRPGTTLATAEPCTCFTEASGTT